MRASNPVVVESGLTTFVENLTKKGVKRRTGRG